MPADVEASEALLRIARSGSAVAIVGSTTPAVAVLESCNHHGGLVVACRQRQEA